MFEGEAYLEARSVADRVYKVGGYNPYWHFPNMDWSTLVAQLQVANAILVNRACLSEPGNSGDGGGVKA